MDKYIKQFQTVLGLRDRGQLAEAVGLCRRFVDSRAPIGEGWNLVASAAQQMGDISTAEKAARRYVEDKPEEGARKLFLAGIMADSPKIEEAAKLARENIEQYKNVADLNFLAGLLNARAGRVEEAEKHFRNALACDPAHGRSWEYLTYTAGKKADGDDYAAMESLEKEDRFPTDEDRIALQYALARASHNDGRYEDAWRRFSEGARLAREENKFDLEALEAYTGRLKRRFSKDYIRSFEGMGSVSRRPIFVVGMPRAGTSLVERLLATLDNVQPGGDLPFIRLATLPIKNMEQDEIESFLGQVKEASGGLMDPWKNLADNYLSLHGEYFGSSAHVTDKQLGNHLFIGAIKLMFPDAKIIYMRRDLLDTALACFATRFSAGNHWSYSFEDIAHYARLYEELMTHWEKLFPDSILVISYEDLIENPAAEAARLLDHCRLEGRVDFDDREIREALSDAAGEGAKDKPVPFASVGLSKHYQKRLEPHLSHFTTGPQPV